jgi:hypothetical protein
MVRYVWCLKRMCGLALSSGIKLWEGINARQALHCVADGRDMHRGLVSCIEV